MCAWRCKPFKLCVWCNVRLGCLGGLFRHRGGEVTGVKRVAGVRATSRVLFYGVEREFGSLPSRAYGAIWFNISISDMLWYLFFSLGILRLVRCAPRGGGATEPDLGEFLWEVACKLV